MLRWQKPPTPKFQAFVSTAIAMCLAQADERWIERFPRLGRVFTEKQAEEVLTNLLAAHESAAVYQVNDYHWLLLWEVLHAYHAAERPVPWPTFDHWVSPDSGYFWDTDFLIPEVAELGPEKRKQLDLSDAAFSIAAGLRAHPDELKLTKCSRCPVCGLALLEEPGEVVPEHSTTSRRGKHRVCPGVGREAL